MEKSIGHKIIEKMKRGKRGKVFLTRDFEMLGDYDSCRKALERLVKRGEIMRVSRGIYTIPKISKFSGTALAPIDETVQAIMKRENTKIIPTGSLAKNLLHLSTQVPMKTVYLTDGNPRKLTIGKGVVHFKKASAKNFATKGKLSTLAIQALKTIRKDYVTEQHIKKVVNILKNENPKLLEHDMMFAPKWIREIMRKALPQTN
jgi:predicted transcriptional regulator of viral defense system